MDAFKQSAGRSMEGMKTLGIVGAAAFAGLTAAAYSFIKAGAEFEQTQIAFTTMLGSAEKAQKTLADLADFAAKTPFELPQLEQASKQLLAYGIESEKLIPTLKNLGDIAAGVGMDKLPQMILAFGQVKAATKLTGAELRQFTEAGVPVLDALVQHFNETGKAAKTVTNAAGLTTKQIDKLGKTTDSVKGKISSLTHSLEKQNNRLQEMQSKGKASGSTYQNLILDIDKNKRKLAELNAEYSKNTGTLNLASQAMTSVGAAAKVTAADVQEMISDGTVSFEDLQAALAGLTGEGGKFFNLMENQSQSLAGLWSNFNDQISLTSRVFGEQLVPYLKPVVEKMIELMGVVREFVQENPKLSAGLFIGALAFSAIAAVLLPLAIALPLIVSGLGLMGAALTTVIVPGALAASAAMIGFIVLIGVAAATGWILYKNWEDITDAIAMVMLNVSRITAKIFETMINSVIDMINSAIGEINKMINKLKSIPIIGKQFGGMSISSLNRVDLGSKMMEDAMVGLSNEMMGRDKGRTAGEMLTDKFTAMMTKPATSTTINVTGNTLLDDKSGVKIGDQIMNALKLSNSV